MLSELVGPRPNAAVVGVVGALASVDLSCSALSRFEIDRGLSLMAEGRRRTLYTERYAALLAGLGGGVLALDERVAIAAADITVTARARGTSLDDHLFDALIAATASVHGLVVLTRNAGQFRAAGVAFENPWTPRQGPG